MNLRGIFGLLFFLGFLNQSWAQVDLQILHTGDIHSHFTNRDSEFGLGGLDRLKTKIQERQDAHSNTLLLDGGDFSEGNIFYTINHGAATNQLMEALGYDAIVLGNHDWLVGPDKLYINLARSQFKIPILSANINLSPLAKGNRIHEYIKPYIIKEFGSLRVGILGLSTFQLVFDGHLKPVKLKEPTIAAMKMVRRLKKEEKCDVVVILSHLGLPQDKLVASLVDDVDLIVGGHSHTLMQKPLVVNGTPIVHAGKWGEHLGEVVLSYYQGQTTVKSFTSHPIHSEIKPDPWVKQMIQGSLDFLKETKGDIFDDNIFYSEVDLRKNKWGESLLGNWSADSIRATANAEIGLDHSSFIARTLYRGWSSTVDIFNIFPHLIDHRDQKTWTVKKLTLSGFALKAIMSVAYRTGLGLSLSNAEVILDKSALLDPIYNARIDHDEIDLSRRYVVGIHQGFMDVLEFIKKFGVNFDQGTVVDTGVTWWESAREFFVAKSPVTRDSFHWKSRVRTLQPDLIVRGEDFMPRISEGVAVINFRIRNNGLHLSQPTGVIVSLGTNSVYGLLARVSKFFEGKKGEEPMEAKLIVPRLSPGPADFSVEFDVSSLAPGRYPVRIYLEGFEGEAIEANNTLDTYLNVP